MSLQIFAWCFSKRSVLSEFFSVPDFCRGRRCLGRRSVPGKFDQNFTCVVKIVFGRRKPAAGVRFSLVSFFPGLRFRLVSLPWLVSFLFLVTTPGFVFGKCGFSVRQSASTRQPKCLALLYHAHTTEIQNVHGRKKMLVVVHNSSRSALRAQRKSSTNCRVCVSGRAQLLPKRPSGAAQV